MGRWLIALASLLASCAAFNLTESHPFFSNGALLEQRMQDVRPKEHARYAIILGANPELRHIGNISMAYQALLAHGYHAPDIFVLAQDVEVPYYGFTDQLNVTTLASLFRHLGDIIGPDDTIIVYVTGHGDAGPLLDMAGGERVPLEDVLLMLVGLNVGRGYLVTDVCYWDQHAFVDSCDWTTVTLAPDGYTTNGNSFGKSFWTLLRDDPIMALDQALGRAKTGDGNVIHIHPACNGVGVAFDF